MTLLNEAGYAGSRLGSDYSHRWTAFGPANVLLTESTSQSASATPGCHAPLVLPPVTGG